MARALMGHVGSPSDQILAAEIVRLRRRVTELEAEIARLREADRSDQPTADKPDFDLRLRRIADSPVAGSEPEPALA